MTETITLIHDRNGTMLESANLADMMFLINSLNFDLVADDGNGLCYFNDDWHFDIGGVELQFVDGVMAIHHFLEYNGWAFGLDLVTYSPHSWQKEYKDVKRAFGFLCRSGFDDRIKWAFGKTQKYNDIGWYDVTVTKGNPFSWAVNNAV